MMIFLEFLILISRFKQNCVASSCTWIYLGNFDSSELITKTSNFLLKFIILYFFYIFLNNKFHYYISMVISTLYYWVLNYQFPYTYRWSNIFLLLHFFYTVPSVFRHICIGVINGKIYLKSTQCLKVEL